MPAQKTEKPSFNQQLKVLNSWKTVPKWLANKKPPNEKVVIWVFKEVFGEWKMLHRIDPEDDTFRDYFWDMITTEKQILFSRLRLDLCIIHKERWRDVIELIDSILIPYQKLYEMFPADVKSTAPRP